MKKQGVGSVCHASVTDTGGSGELERQIYVFFSQSIPTRKIVYISSPKNNSIAKVKGLKF
jgi:hypothetical protein